MFDKKKFIKSVSEVDIIAINTAINDLNETFESLKEQSFDLENLEYISQHINRIDYKSRQISDVCETFQRQLKNFEKLIKCC